MFIFNPSIRTRLTLFMSAFTVLFLGLAAVATTSLLIIDDKTEAIGEKWLVGTRLLDELHDHLAEFRIAETYRALATESGQLASAQLLADQHRKALLDLLDEYVTTLGEESTRINPESFRAAWQTYLQSHDAWVRADVDGMEDGPARSGSSLHRLYRATMVAADQLIEMNRNAALLEVTGADELVDRTIAIVLIVSALGVLLAGWLLVRVHSEITRPLGAITGALTKLAAGNRDVHVPEMNRADEIGDMAKAFDVFRSNAVSLEQAHEATRAAQEQAQALARHDALTGLPNRRVFAADLQLAISHSQNGSAKYAVMIIDLDRFKPVNDLQGHPIGDLVLCEVARRLRETVRKGDTVARLGGDEFAIIAREEQQPQLEGTKQLAGRLLSAVREPIVFGDNHIEIGASIGIAFCPGDGFDAENLLRSADIAMYRAKREGRGSFRFFEQSMDDELRGQAALEADLRTAIGDEQIVPHYQPLVDMHNNRISGFEILARWQHPERGAIPPDVFIPLAEQLGLIADLTWSMLRQACRDAAQWPSDIRLSLNISPLQLKDPVLPAALLTILNQEGFPPSRLEIEITETALVSDIETAKLILTSLQAIGIKISLDDFGTGYSSLYHLRELKFDKVKIDRSFVQSMEDNDESEKIVDAILSLAKSLGMPTVAEGVENPAVLRHLAIMGCEYAQGYHFGKAVSAESVTERLAGGRLSISART